MDKFCGGIKVTRRYHEKANSVVEYCVSWTDSEKVKGLDDGEWPGDYATDHYFATPEAAIEYAKKVAPKDAFGAVLVYREERTRYPTQARYDGSHNWEDVSSEVIEEVCP
jgi:hypothetical protein